MVTVVGLGFVGLTTALGFAEYGHTVYGIESSEEKLKSILSGRIPFEEPGLIEALSRHLGKKFFPVLDWKKAVLDSDYIFFCVGTPCGEDGKADLTALFCAISSALKEMTDGKFRVLTVKSTIPPCTTKDKILPFVREQGFDVPSQIGISNNPEFLREGHCWDDFINTDRIVLGVEDERSADLLRKLYAPSRKPVYTVNYNTGEFIKYLSNTSLAALISFSNEMSLVADVFGDIQIADAFRILHLDSRWQNGSIRQYVYPGCGYGGYCLPKDTKALCAASKAKGYTPRILSNVISINESMPEKTAERIMLVTGNDKEKKIGILGLSFNAGSDDVRDAVSARIIGILLSKGYSRIAAYDPIAMENFKNTYGYGIEYLSSADEVIDACDVIAIVTRWPEFSELKGRTDKTVVDCVYML